ncbi:hypothetical protein ACGFR8_07780 [Streptomyces brevispora]|uniref:hypothetical protein n=1 Tax=Streptomyces brevispora TaxID=887462 RepID=UPI00371098F6
MTDIDRRMTEAASAESRGQYREAAGLYQQLGKDMQAQHGRFDPRALDAYEKAARAVRKDSEASP